MRTEKERPLGTGCKGPLPCTIKQAYKRLLQCLVATQHSAGKTDTHLPLSLVHRAEPAHAEFAANLNCAPWDLHAVQRTTLRAQIRGSSAQI